QGRVAPGVEIRITDPTSGEELPWDGVAFGEIQVRGPWIARGYHNGYDPGKLTEDGWFRTGDVAKISPDGYIQIVDRTKDVIKSGGEWISSVELENAIMAHPKIMEAAVIGLAHPKWDERPVAFAVPKPEFKGHPAVKLTQLDFNRLYPLGGPVFVKGAQPGDVLEVDIIDLRPGAWGWTGMIPGLGLLAADFPDPYIRYFDLGDRKTAELRKDIQIPLAPFCGTM